MRPKLAGPTLLPVLKYGSFLKADVGTITGNFGPGTKGALDCLGSLRSGSASLSFILKVRKGGAAEAGRGRPSSRLVLAAVVVEEEGGEVLV